MGSVAIGRIVLCALVLSVSFIASSGKVMHRVGGWRDSSERGNSAEIEDLARFAIDEHNKKENSILEFVRVVKAKEQVVAGIMHHLTLEVIDAGNKKFYEAKIWVKPWLHFKQLQDFKPSNEDVKMEDNVIGNKVQQGS